MMTAAQSKATLDAPDEVHDLLDQAITQEFPQLSKEINAVKAWPMDRIRESGPRVYRVRLALKDGGQGPEPTSRFFFAKIPDHPNSDGQALQLGKEWTQYKRFVAPFLTMCPKAWAVADDTAPNRVWCLCCEGAGTHPQKLPIPLHNLLQKPSDFSTNDTVSTIRDVFGYQSPWKQHRQKSEFTLANEYKKYHRWGRRTKLFLSKWLGREGRASSALYLRESGLRCPWTLLERIRDERRKLSAYKRPVHGDLHQRNIIVDRLPDKIVPWLIDFEWTAKRHALIDYALLEASLKLFHFARFFRETDYLALHDCLHYGDRPRSLEAHEYSDTMLRTVSAIRELARKEVYEEDRWPFEYYMSSFLITMGLLGMGNCAVQMGYLTAAWLALHIEQQYEKWIRTD